MLSRLFGAEGAHGFEADAHHAGYVPATRPIRAPSSGAASASRRVRWGVQGHAIEPDADLSGIDRLAKHYTGKPYPNRDNERVNAWLEIESYHTWGHQHR